MPTYPYRTPVPYFTVPVLPVNRLIAIANESNTLGDAYCDIETAEDSTD